VKEESAPSVGPSLIPLKSLQIIDAMLPATCSAIGVVVHVYNCTSNNLKRQAERQPSVSAVDVDEETSSLNASKIR
jgi:hypothetical protein